MYLLLKEQKKALAHLAESYSMLSGCWLPDWEGPENFGGVLDELGVLPRASIDEAAANLLHLIDDVQIKKEKVFSVVLQGQDMPQQSV